MSVHAATFAGLMAGLLALTGASAMHLLRGFESAELSGVQGARGDIEVLRYRVTGPENYSASDVRSIQDWIIAQSLSTVPGVAQVLSQGGGGGAYRPMFTRGAEDQAMVTATVTMAPQARRQSVQAAVEAAMRRLHRNGSLPRGFQLALLDE
ncbi:MAG: hypothetical protein JO370_12480 [Paucibacter sp.]|nr:hypothetical protein [Roseateles sp.]